MALTSEEFAICNQALGKIGASQIVGEETTSEQSVQCLLHFDQTRNALLRSFEWPFAKTRLRLVAGWVTDTIYTTDQYVWQSGLLYKCAVAHTSDVFATDLTAVKWTLQSTVSAWVTLTVYAVGDVVTTNALYYKCLTAHTAGVFADDLESDYWVASTTKPTNVFGYNYDIPASCIRLVKNFLPDSWNWTERHPYTDQYHRWQLETNTILTDDTEVDIVYIDTIDTTTEWDALFMELFIVNLALKLFNPLTGIGGGAASTRELLLREQHALSQQTRTIGYQEGNNSGSSDWNNARYL